MNLQLQYKEKTTYRFNKHFVIKAGASFLIT